MDIALKIHTTYTTPNETKAKNHKPSNTIAHTQLLEGCIRQERRSQKRLYELYYGCMLSVCMRYTNNYEEARDVLHEGFMKVFKNIARYKPSHSLNSWIKRIMINTAIDHYRKNKKHQSNVDLEYAAHETDVNIHSVLTKLSAEEILKLVQKLSPAYRTVFNLYVIEGYNHREIAERLNISEGTSKSNLAKARAKLRGMIEKELPDYTHYFK
jgi:RNA polymerase sigma factor (sigma-70 family)